MEKIIEADQGRPYKIMRNKLLHGSEYKELLSIVKRNIPNITANEIIEMFKSMADSGCSSCMLANLLGKELFKDDESFKNMFGFSISNKGTLDYNKILVDIYSKLYGVMKAKFIEYNTYTFKSIKEAALNLLGKEYSDDMEASINLFNNGIKSDGIDSNGNLVFKSREPKITNYVGTASEISKKKFEIDVNSLEELKQICLSKNINLECTDLQIYEKLSGLKPTNFNFWSNYYLEKTNIDYSLNSEDIIISDFNNDYNKFLQYINSLVLEGYEISVGTTPNSSAQMHNKKLFSWSQISSESSGHVMLFKKFNKDNDIVVSSYGEDYTIPKEFYSILEFRKIKVTSKENLIVKK